MKRPAFQFYPGDWQHDAALRSCSVAARGLWIEMMCVMHQAEPYGTLTLNGDAIDMQQLGRMVGAGAKETARWLTELEAAGAFSRDADGRIYSRRMVRDERVRNVRAEAGRLGGNPDLLGRKDNHSSHSKDNHQVVHKVKVKPTPSSSSSSSSSSSTASSTSKARSKARTHAHETPLPPDFGISPRVQTWADGKGYGALDLHLEVFKSKALAKGYTYADWDEGFMGAIRADWAGIRSGNAGARPHNPNRQESLEERNLRVANAWTPPEDP